MEGRPFVCSPLSWAGCFSPPSSCGSGCANCGLFSGEMDASLQGEGRRGASPLLFLQALLSSLGWPCLSCSRLPLPGHRCTSRLSSCRSR